MKPHPIATWDALDVDTPTGVLVSNVDLVVVRFGPSADDHSVLYGRCLHRGCQARRRTSRRREPDLWCSRLGLPVGLRRVGVQQR